MSQRQEALSRTLDLLEELIQTDRYDIDDALAAARVRVVVDPSDLDQAPTQAAIYVLASLVVRSGIRLEVDFAAVARRLELPGLVGDDFGTGLATAVRRMFPGATLLKSSGDADIAVVFGAAEAPPAATILRVGSSGRTAHLSRSRASLKWRPSGTLPALAAAGLAAVEIHKDVLRPLASPGNEVLEPLEPAFTVPFEIKGPVDLGSVIAVSAGAITQNMLLTLVADVNVRGRLRLLDGDVTALSNANRCPYVLLDDLGQSKVAAIAALVPQRIEIEPIGQHLDVDTVPLIERGATIVVGADDVAARHRAQTCGPDWIAVGATSHFFALITEHPAGTPCAGCAHPQLGEDLSVIPTISIVSFWAGYLLALRLLARVTGVPYPAGRRVSNFWPLRPDSILQHGLTWNPRCPVGHEGGHENALASRPSRHS